MSRMIVFDDRDFPRDDPNRVNLGPMADLRASFDIRTGMLTTVERLLREWPDGFAGAWVPEELREIVGERSPVPVNELPDGDERYFLANGRWTYPAAKFEISVGQALVETDGDGGGDVIAAELERGHAEAFLASGVLPDAVEVVPYEGRMLVRRPWEVIGGLAKVLMTDLMSMDADQSEPIPDGVTTMGDQPIILAPNTRVSPGAILDSSSGPIILDEYAAVRPGAIVCGPAYVGPGSVILEHALIKPNTSIGPVCKIAGEVGGTIFQGFSNKSHDGHLGDSFVGEWVNFGAGTTNSNLLNTYGEITSRPTADGSNERTGMQYLGSIIGDHVKFAIQSRLMAGSVFGTGSMVAVTGAAPGCVAPFTWLTDAGSRRYRFEKFIQVAETVLQRRDIALSDATRKHLELLHAQSASS